MNTPFIDFKATEISPEKQKCFFVEPKYINKLISTKASIITGERGSGKTTILRHLEKMFNQSDELDYIGIYYRFETAYVKALFSSELTAEQNIAGFAQAIAATVGRQLCRTLEEIKNNKNIEYESEQYICNRLLSDIEINEEINIKSFGELADVYEKIRKKILINIQNGKNVCFFDYTSFLSDFCEMLRQKETMFSNSCFCILIDEYENLTMTQQRVINSFIKNSSYYLTFKVCMRPDGFWTKNTVAEKEQLIPGHDYEDISYVKDIIGNDSDVKIHIRKICANRLEYFYRYNHIPFKEEDLDIDQYLEVVKDDASIESWSRIEEYKENLRNELKKRYPKKRNIIDQCNAIDLKLIFILGEKRKNEDEIFSSMSNKTEQYKNWIHNYKKNIIAQIASECEQDKIYCGLNVFIKLSNSNTRFILEILYYAFGELDTTDNVYPKISVVRQTEAVKRIAKYSIDEINYIPFNGYKVRNLVNSLGNLFNMFLNDKRAKKFEVNNFSIRSTTMLEEETKELRAVLKDAVVWGILIPTTVTKKKQSSNMVFDDRDYILHPIFAPYFQISYSKRQKCELDDRWVYLMLKAVPSSVISNINKNILEEDVYYQQKFEWSNM